MEHLVAALEEEEAAAATATAIGAASASAAASVRGGAHAPPTLASLERDGPTAMDVDDDAGAQAMDEEDDPASSDEGEDFVSQGDEARGQVAHRTFAAQAPAPRAHDGRQGLLDRASPASSSDAFPPWQAMFRQLQDFHALGHRSFPPRLALWMNSQRRRYKRYGLGWTKPTGILVHRIRQLNAIDFDWRAPPYKPAPDSDGASAGESDEDLSDDESVRRPRGRDEGHHDHDPGAKNWTPEEDEGIDRLQSRHGNRWSVIAAALDTGRTKDEIKNRWGWMRRRGLVRGDGAPRSPTQRAGSAHGGAGAMGGRALQRQDSGDRLGTDRRPYGRHVEGMVKAALEEERRKTLAKKYGRSNRARRAASRRGAESTDDSDASGGGCAPYPAARRRGSGHEAVRSDGGAGGGGRKRNPKTAFPALLYDMVTDCTEHDPHVCEWTAEGDAFAIKNAQLMPPAIGRYFQHSNYRSLQRMCYHYNFKRCSDEYDGVYYHPRFNRWSSKEELVNAVIKGGDVGGVPPTKRPRGRPKGSLGKKKRESHKREKQFERFGEGAVHPGLLFEDEDEGEGEGEDEDESKDDDEEASAGETRVTNPGPADMALSLAFPPYKRILFARFQNIGRKAPEGDDRDEMREVAQAILARIRRTTRRAGGGGGRLLKAVKGKAWYEVVDKEWAVEKIGNDLRRRMESSHQWLNKATIVDDEDCDDRPMDLEGEGEPPSGKSDEVAALASTEDQCDGAKEPGSTSNDLVVSLDAPTYRKAMFARFQELGEKADADDPERIKAAGKAILDGFKKDLGETGRFFQRAGGAGDGEAPLEAIDDEAALTLIEQDLRKRMESANSWLNVNLDALPKESAELKPEPLTSVKPDAVASADVVMSDAPGSPTSVQTPAPPNWNLGSVSSPGVTYYKSGIGKYWVEQVVPRKTVRDRGPYVDRYYLSPDGRRFRSMAEVQRFLEETGQAKAVSGEEEEESNEGELAEAVSYGSEEEDEGGRRSPDSMPCNCKKSKCLKLYCDCFNKERYCAGCSCIGCRNTPVYDAQRDRAIADILDKNPDAFKHRNEEMVCKCRRTGCLKKYCECYARGKYCGDTCRCRDCENLPLESLDEGEGGEEVESVDGASEEEEEEEQDGKRRAVSDPYSQPYKVHAPASRAAAQQVGGGKTIMMKCPHCLEVKTFVNPMTAAASFSNHVRACGQKAGAKESKKSKMRTCPHCKRDFNFAGYTNHVRACEQEKKKSQMRTCPHCNRDFNIAGYTNHVRACGQKSPEQQKKSPEQQKSQMRTCPHCNRDFNFAGYTNHVRACGGQSKSPSPEKKKSQMRTCPHCKRDFNFAGYTNHVRACDGQSKWTSPKKKKSTMRTCPHCKRDFNFAGYTNHVRACEQSQGTKPKAAKPESATNAAGKVTMQCPHCLEIKYFQAGTAAASLSNHVRACSKKHGLDPDEAVAAVSTAAKKPVVPLKPPSAKGPAKKYEARRQCPHCLEMKFFPNPMTGPASFNNHVRACGKKKQAREEAAQKVPPKPNSATHAGGITMQCPHCLEVKVFSNPGTAAASFSHHVTACAKRKSAGDKAEREAEEREAATPKSPDSAEKLSYKCPKCYRKFIFSKKTAVASFGNHVKKCNPDS